MSQLLSSARTPAMSQTRSKPPRLPVADHPPKTPPIDLERVMREATRLSAPFKTRGYDDSYRGGEGGVTIFRTGSSTGGPAPEPLRYLWFHGFGQRTANEMIIRLANSFHEAGLNLEIMSVPHEGSDGIELARSIITSRPGKVLIGGHSAGGIPVIDLAAAIPDRIAGVVTVNGGSGRMRGLPTLRFVGENDDGSKFLPERFAWGDHQIFATHEPDVSHVVLREGDHSARFRERTSHDKRAASVSAETQRMNFALAETLRDFLRAKGITPK